MEIREGDRIKFAVGRLTEFADRSSLSIIDQISMLATGEATVGALVDDIQTVLAELEDLRGLHSLTCQAVDKHKATIKTQSAEIERLRADCERFRAEADIANAQVKAWNEAVYVEGIPRRAIPDTDYGDKVPPIPHVEPKRLTDLLSERGRLRAALSNLLEYTADLNPSQGLDADGDHPAVSKAAAVLKGGDA